MFCWQRLRRMYKKFRLKAAAPHGNAKAFRSGTSGNFMQHLAIPKLIAKDHYDHIFTRRKRISR